MYMKEILSIYICIYKFDLTWTLLSRWMFPLMSTNLTLSMDIIVISTEIVSLHLKYLI